MNSWIDSPLNSLTKSKFIRPPMKYKQQLLNPIQLCNPLPQQGIILVIDFTLSSMNNPVCAFAHIFIWRFSTSLTIRFVL